MGQLDMDDSEFMRSVNNYNYYSEIPSEYTSGKTDKYSRALKHLIPIRKSKPKTKHLEVDDAGFFSIISFSWLSDYIYKAYKKGLTIDDIPLCSPNDSCDLNSRRLESLWKKELLEKGPSKASFGLVMWKFVRTRIYVGCLTFSLSCIMGFLCPVLFMRKLLEYLENRDEPISNGLVWAIALTSAELLRIMFFALYYSLGYRTAARLRSACLCLAYKKILKISNLKNISAGEIVNLISFDGPRLFYMIIFGPMAIGGPLLSISGFAYIQWILGPWALLGMIIFASYYPLQYLLSHLTGYFRRKAIKETDKRIKITTEILTSIKLIKMYAWENWFSNHINDVRRKELKQERKISYFQSIGMSMAVTIPIISGISTFLVHVATGGNLGASQAYTVLAILLTQLRTALSNIRWGSENFIQGRIISGRFQRVLLLEENTTKIPRESDDSLALTIKGGDFVWDVSVSEPMIKEKDKLMEAKSECFEVLHSIDISIPKGALIGVCGPVGAGKSSLLLACLGQLKMTRGQITRSGSCAYVSQETWLENDSLKNNIIFGEKFDPKKYIKVIHACSLNKDINFLPGGDETEIGERGVNLSGGQKQRLSLARALYADRDIYFLDDPFSAVDTEVGVQIFQNYVLEALADKTVILVTRQVQFLQKCDEVWIMKEGRIVGRGSYPTLLAEDKEFGLMMDTYTLQTNREETAWDKMVEFKPLMNGDKLEDLKTFTPKKLTQSEEQVQGNVKPFAYKAYITACGGYFVSFIVVLIIFVNISCTFFSSWWLAMWIKAGGGNTTIIDPSTNETIISRDLKDNPDLPYYMTVYGATVGVIVLSCVIRGFVYTRVTIGASKSLHWNLFDKILKSPLSYFERTPIGQIQNLVSRDMNEVDTRLPEAIEMMLQSMWSVVFSFLSITLVFPWFIVPLVILGCSYYFLSKIFRVAIRDLKRIDNISRAPVLSSISTTVQGLSVIHAFNKERDYSEQFCKLFDENATVSYLSSNAMRWMAVRFDLISVVIIFITSLLVAVNQQMAPALAGLALSFAAQICGVFQYTIRLLSENEARFISVERIQGIIKKLESEGNPSEEIKVPRNWPSQGAVKFHQVVLSYGSDCPNVLNEVSFSIEGGEKIGVVGRTGAGKSSLAAALFRLVEIKSGIISVDGINIKKVPLPVLRNKLSVIPQDPILFSDSLRSNLDPFRQYDDGKLWEVLRKAKLINKVKSLPHSLESYVGEGENLSVGEKQLLCLARTLLRESKILILDEATASIDPETEKTVQTAIQEEFKDCTVITIAHRLKTVINCDRILVIDQGKILEFDNPKVLMNNPHSQFSKMLSAAEMQH